MTSAMQNRDADKTSAAVTRQNLVLHSDAEAVGSVEDASGAKSRCSCERNSLLMSVSGS